MVCVWAPKTSATALLESGRIVLYPAGFALYPEELRLKDPALCGGAKNISLAADGTLKHAAATPAARLRLKTMMARYAAFALDLVTAIAPQYRGRLIRGRTSFRPTEIAGRRSSVLKDDSRLHVDAFPARPTGGMRILRVFTNVNDAEPRSWNVGEPFQDMAGRFLPLLHPTPRALTTLYAAIGLTKGRRTRYDDLMLGLHNAAKRDHAYQASSPKQALAFPSGSVWVCYTDVVMHAALKGQHALEQTFLVPVDAMAEPSRSPLRILEAMTGRTLT